MCDEPFDEAEPESFDLFDVEAGGAYLGQGTPQEVFAPPSGMVTVSRRRCTTRAAQGRTFDVIDEDQSSAGTQHPVHFFDRASPH